LAAYFTFLRENVRWLLGGFLLTFFSSFGQTFFISLSGGEIRAAYGLSNGEFGTLYMLATLCSALVLPQFGKLVDRFSVSQTALIVIPMLMLATVSMAYSNSLWLLAVTIFALRLFGQGMMTHISMTAMGRWYAGHRGRAVSIATMGHQVGEGVFPLLFVRVAALVGWRNPWLMAALVLLAVALPLIHSLMKLERQPKSTDAPDRRTGARQWTRSEVLRDPLFWLMSLGMFAPGFIGTTIFFHQDYLLEIRNWPAEAFAASFVIMAAMTILFALISGILVDRYSAIRLLAFFLLPLALACFGLAGIEAEYGIFVFMGTLGVSYGVSSTLFGALWPEMYGVKHLGAIRSIIISMMVLSTALGPGVTGFLIDLGVSYPTQIFVMGIYCVAASLVMMFVSRRALAREIPLAPSTVLSN